jgi:hypothetical protein
MKNLQIIFLYIYIMAWTLIESVVGIINKHIRGIQPAEHKSLRNIT